MVFAEGMLVSIVASQGTDVDVHLTGTKSNRAMTDCYYRRSEAKWNGAAV